MLLRCRIAPKIGGVPLPTTVFAPAPASSNALTISMYPLDAAAYKGVKPPSCARSAVALFSNSCWTVCLCPWQAAANSGVTPVFGWKEFGSTPSCRAKSTATESPRRADECRSMARRKRNVSLWSLAWAWSRGLRPKVSETVMEAPWATRALAKARFPDIAATIRGVHPSSTPTFTSTCAAMALSTKALSPCRQAATNNVSPG
mmetsp:Transcript_15454/g.34101  ORF Transcript_15454/g.34101 Transcript_15454/m.34101 type:complete len:203 (-) Transcript_15454:453-1061(-)